jgi:hypothetical protein
MHAHASCGNHFMENAASHKLSIGHWSLAHLLDAYRGLSTALKCVSIAPDASPPYVVVVGEGGIVLIANITERGAAVGPFTVALNEG